MGTPLRLLLLEDSEDDALLLELELRRGGYDVSLRRVQTESGMRAALASHAIDIRAISLIHDRRLGHRDHITRIGADLDSHQHAGF